MADRHVVARLRVTPCGLFEPLTHTMTLAKIGDRYRLEVQERHALSKKQTRRYVALPTRDVDAQLAALKTAFVPAFPVSPMVCDGEYVELTIEGEFSTLVLGWWTVAPAGADSIAAFADWLRAVGQIDGDGLEDDPEQGR